MKPDMDERIEKPGHEDTTSNSPIANTSEKVIADRSNGVQQHKSHSKRNSLVNQPVTSDRTEAPSVEKDARLDALSKERETLREEVAQMRRSLEELQERHAEEMSGIREQLTLTEEGKEQAETQYQSLLGKVNTIRSQLGERLKADAVCKTHSKPCIWRH